jgi:hypothetical protein
VSISRTQIELGSRCTIQQKNLIYEHQSKLKHTKMPRSHARGAHFPPSWKAPALIALG